LDTNKFAKELKKHNPAFLTQKPEGSNIKSAHFILVGDKRFRAETDHDQAKAIASFNRESIGETLSEIFTQIKSNISQEPVTN